MGTGTKSQVKQSLKKILLKKVNLCPKCYLELKFLLYLLFGVSLLSRVLWKRSLSASFSPHWANIEAIALEFELEGIGSRSLLFPSSSLFLLLWDINYVLYKLINLTQSWPCNPVQPWTHKPPVSASHMLRLQGLATTSKICFAF